MIKKEMVTKEEETTICDGCGVVITEDNKGIFSVVEYYNGASYRKRGEEVVGYETGTYLNKFGNFCIDCTTKLHENFIEAMKKAGFRERYSLCDGTAPQDNAKIISRLQE